MKVNALASLAEKALLTKFQYERELGDNEVMTKVQYRSLYAGDAFFVDNFWHDTKYPIIPSTEYFGTVVALGKNVVNLRVGDYVGVGYQVYACRECSSCLAETPQYCSSQKVICIGERGGLADYAFADSNFVFPIPHSLRTPNHVSLMCAGLTVYSAIKKANLKNNSEVGVVGIGNLGHFAVQILAKMGHSVTAFSHTPSKAISILDLGAKDVISSIDDLAITTQSKKLDYVLVTTYANLNWTKFLEILKPTGTLAFVGLPNQPISFPVINLADYAGKNISGGYLGSPLEMKELLALASTLDVHGQTELFKLSQANLVLDKIRRQQLRYSAVLEN